MSMIVQTLAVLETDAELSLEEAIQRRFEDGEQRLAEKTLEREEVYVGVA